MQADHGRAIAARALSAVGTPFRLHGRTKDIALDCVGLACFATGCVPPSLKYRIKGSYCATICSYLENCDATPVESEAQVRDGDVVLVSCSARQQHLMVRAANGWVHAHAGLGRVVHMPGPSPWPIIAIWRFRGG